MASSTTHYVEGDRWARVEAVGQGFCDISLGTFGSYSPDHGASEVRCAAAYAAAKLWVERGGLAAEIREREATYRARIEGEGRLLRGGRADV